jgi:F0F1-type ATP synthase assembly protein I
MSANRNSMGVTSVLILRLKIPFFRQIFLVLVGILVNIAIVNPYFIIMMIFLGFCYYGVTTVYLRTSRNVKRLEAISKPVF